MRITLHPGMPKCGSTTIQTFAAGMQSRLAKRGIYYEPLGLLAGLPPMEQQIEAFIDSVPDDAEQVLISHEDLMSWRRDRAVPLVQSLAKRGNVELVVVVRPVREWIIAKEKQRISSLAGKEMGNPPSLTAWFDVWLGKDMEAMLSKKPTLVDLHDERGLLPAFLDAAGIDVPEKWLTWTPPVMNPSLQGADFQVAYLVNDALIAARQAGASGTLDTDRDFRDHRKFLRGLLQNGNHHRKPMQSTVEGDLRVELILFFLTEMESALHAAVPKGSDESKRISRAMKDARGAMQSEAVDPAIETAFIRSVVGEDEITA